MQWKPGLFLCLACAFEMACSSAAPAAQQSPPAVPSSVLTSSGKANAAGAADDDAQASAHDGEDDGIRPAYRSCMTNQPIDESTAGHRQGCAEDEYDFQDGRLNRAYAATLAAMDARGLSEDARKLQLAQRQWLSWLDTACTGEQGAASGMGPAVQTTCLMEETAKRARAIEQLQDDINK